MFDFLFIAETYNGQLIRQTQADVSLKYPGKNAYYDVLQEHIKRFSLMGKGQLFTVDLTDGHIEINGKSVLPPQRPPEQTELHLIYYKQVQQRMDMKFKTKPKTFLNRLGILSDPSQKQLSPIIRYYIGWEAHYKGKNYKFEMGID